MPSTRSKKLFTKISLYFARLFAKSRASPQAREDQGSAPSPPLDATDPQRPTASSPLPTTNYRYSLSHSASASSSPSCAPPEEASSSTEHLRSGPRPQAFHAPDVKRADMVDIASPEPREFTSL